MSGSDSDLEYESADDDTTEHDISEKDNVSESVEILEKEKIPVAIGNIESTYGNEKSATLEENVTGINLPDTKTENTVSKENIACTDLSDVKTADISSKENTTGNYLSDKKEDDGSIEESTTCINVSDGTTEDTVPQQSIQKDAIVKQDELDSLLESSNLTEKKSKQESQRVPLRLEKKIQQKNQQSKQSDEQKFNVTTGINDVKEEIDSNVVDQKGKSSSWGFSGWGTSLLSTAATSVSTFSSQVSQGIGTVFETVESTLGAPSPEELASSLKEKREQAIETEEVENNETEEGSGIIPDVSSWTKVFESTGSKVIMGGLDTLEFLGKKTMDILTEGDPGLRNKRHVFSDGINLSQMLREAKEKAEKDAQENNYENTDVINYSQLFDDQQGLVHLEALEMLSKQTQVKFQRHLMRHSKKSEVKKRLEEIKSICENIPSLDDPSDAEGFDDFESVFRKHALELNLPLNVDNIVKAQKSLNYTITIYENSSEEPHVPPDEIFRSSICSLAEFTARCIETFHKIAELILVQSNLGPHTEQCATNLTGLTTVMCIEINNLSSRYHKCLDASGEHFINYTNSQGLNITGMVTNLYVEASNSNKYIQDAFQMLVPILQVCLLENLNE